jgi:hypothetical protein
MSMDLKKRLSFILRVSASILLISSPIGMVGCQPEGTGSVKGPATRPPDDALGRPFGNAPQVSKKKPAASTTKKQAVETEVANPRL